MLDAFFNPSLRLARFPYCKRRESAWSFFVLDAFAIPVALFIRRAFGERISADHVSLVTFNIYVLGIALLWLGHAWIAAAVFFAATVLDSVDGKLARMSAVRTRYGGLLDSGLDALLHGPGFIVIACWGYLTRGQLVPALAVVAASMLLTLAHAANIRAMARALSGVERDTTSPASDAGDARVQVSGRIGEVEIACLGVPIVYVLHPIGGWLFVAMLALYVIGKATEPRNA
jgi:phosphatidylglycerophosphate synthase